MAKISLYELTTAYKSIEELTMDDSMDQKEITAALDGVNAEIEEKCANGIALLRSLDERAKMFKAEADRLNGLCKVLENRKKGIKDWYYRNLKSIGKERVTTKYGVMKIQKNGGKQALDINMDILPDKYKVQEIIIKPNNDLIRQALENGEEITGAVLLPRGEGLRI